MRTFKKQAVNENFDYKTGIVKEFNAMGFNPDKIETCFSNGASHYVRVYCKVLNDGKMFADVFVYDGICTLTVRIIDHMSNLERICGGVCGNKVSMEAFKYLVENNIIVENVVED